MDRLGVKTDKGIIDVEKALTIEFDDSISSDIMDVIAGGKEAVGRLDSYISRLDLNETLVISEDAMDWGPCVPRPSKIICVGLNYRKHADETNAPYPETPILFNKFNNTLTGHHTDISLPKVSEKVDYEVELGIVIGKDTKYIRKEDALDHVFGYFTANDLSARDLQFKSTQWLLGKSCDDFSPIGPYLVTKDEVSNPNNLKLQTKVNGEIRQESNTSDMIFACDEIVSYISQHMTLIPGDIILTGTPEGVIMGYPEEEQHYLKTGDEITVEIEKLGALTNRFVAEH